MNPIANTSNNQTKIQTNPSNQLGQHHGKHHKKVESNGMDFSKILDTAQKATGKVK